MHSKKIKKQFFSYMSSLGNNIKYATEDNPPALLFGSDEFKLDIKKSRIRLLSLGWIKINDIELDCNLKDIKWVAIENKDDCYNLIFSPDFNPFDEIAENPLYVNGQIFAVPATLKPSSFMLTNDVHYH